MGRFKRARLEALDLALGSVVPSLTCRADSLRRDDYRCELVARARSHTISPNRTISRVLLVASQFRLLTSEPCVASHMNGFNPTLRSACIRCGDDGRAPTKSATKPASDDARALEQPSREGKSAVSASGTACTTTLRRTLSSGKRQ
jgi:hypothetical protein